MDYLPDVCLAILIAASFVVIVAIILLPPKEGSMGGAIGGGSDDLNLFGKKRSHGSVAFLERVTVISSAVFMIAAFLYNVLVTRI